MAESKTKSAPQAEAAAAEGGLLDQIISKSRIARTDSERDRTRDLIGELVGQVMDGQLVVSRDAIASLDARVRSEEHTSELQSLMRISYAVFCLKKKKHTDNIKSKQSTKSH